MDDAAERERLRFALALVTAWADDEVDAWLSLVREHDTWEHWEPATWGLAQLAYLLAERAACAEGTSARNILEQMAEQLATSGEDRRGSR